MVFTCSQCDFFPPLIHESPLCWAWRMSQRSAVATTPFVFLSVKTTVVVFFFPVCVLQRRGSRRIPMGSGSLCLGAAQPVGSHTLLQATCLEIQPVTPPTPTSPSSSSPVVSWWAVRPEAGRLRVRSPAGLDCRTGRRPPCLALSVLGCT